MTLLKLISTNIRFANPADGLNSWEFRKNFLANTLLDFAPHIIASQEGRKPQILELNELLSDYQLIDGHRPWIEERMYPCLFIQKSWAKVVESGDVWLSETPNRPGSQAFNSLFPRLATWALMELPNKTTIFVINTHLDHIQSETRQKQVEVLLNELGDFLKTYPSIIAGDFNEGPYGKARAVIQNSEMDLLDPWHDLGLPEEGSYHSFKGKFEEKAERIDWILHTKHFSPVSIHLDKSQDGEVFPSDHYPVKTVLKFSAS